MSNPANILIIDDDGLIRLLVRQAVLSAGLNALEASNGAEGLELFKSHDIAAVLLDVMMPNGKDGYETCLELRQTAKGQHIPILMLTGLDDYDSINRAFEVGATDFMTKPINIPLLVHRVRYMLRASQATNDLLESQQYLHRMAYFDSLTGLPNRHYFLEHLTRTVAQARKAKQRLAVLFLDLDGFKRINDTLGHPIGDAFLKAISLRLRERVRYEAFVASMRDSEEVTIARLGGDEFSVLLSPISDEEEVGLTAERIRHILTEPVQVGDHELVTTTSIGIALYPDDGEDAEELLKNADLAMYHAKRSAGNLYRFFSAKMTEAALRRLTLEKKLRKAIERNELDVYYQPQLDIQTGKYDGLEALGRWTNDELGIISPVEFIPLAEETGIIIDLGEWILRRACQQAQTWIRQGLNLSRIAVNVSAYQFRHKSFVNIVDSVLAETGLDPSLLELELTESALVHDEDYVLDILQALKKVGVQLAIDDFGTGYSSLSRLMNFPIDRLKIDRVFVSNLGEAANDGSIATAVIAMAERMGLKVTAEGIETSGQLAFLKDKSCHEGQGFFLCRPLSSEDVQAFLRNEKSD